MHHGQITRRWATAAGAVVAALAVTAAPAGACAGLVTPSGNGKVLRTATLAAHHGGVEHYITSFTFEGGGAEFGAIVPLPAIPTKVERGGDWTLQRLQREVEPAGAAGAVALSASAERDSAEELQHHRIDALDLTVLRGGGKAVGDWAREHGFKLTPDTPEVLDFYATRSPIFLAAVFDADAARERGQQQGEGTPVHITMPLANPWVPLRILTVGQPTDGFVSADVFLLTDKRPALFPLAKGLDIQRDEPASASLLDDLRSDKGMGWMPTSMWLTYVRVGGQPRDFRYDLASDVSGKGRPSAVDAGLAAPDPPPPTTAPPTTVTEPPTPTTAAPQAEEPTVIAAPVRHDRPGGELVLVAAAGGLVGLLAPMLLRVGRRRAARRAASAGQ